MATPTPWVLDGPGAEKSLWFHDDGVASVWTADADVPTTPFATGGAIPYNGEAQTLTVVLDKTFEQPTLLLDGKNLGPARDQPFDIRPHVAPEGAAVTFCPVACCMLVNGNVARPFSAVVEVVSDDTVYATGRLGLARPGDATVDSALMPFPVKHSLVAVEARWRVGEQGDGRSRSLGLYGEGIKRIRSAFAQLRAYRSQAVPGDADQRSLKVGEETKLPPTERTLLQYLRGNAESRIDFNRSEEEQNTYIRVTVVMRAGERPLVWRLQPSAELDNIWSYVEGWRSDTSNIVAEIETHFEWLRDNGVEGLGVPGAENVLFKALIDKINEFGDSGTYNRGFVLNPALENNSRLRVWGPLLKATAPQVPNINAIDESEIVTEARKQVARTVRALRSFFDDLPKSIYLVSWHAPNSNPDGAVQATNVDIQNDDFVGKASRSSALLNPMRLTPSLPVCAACSLGAFEPPDAISEAVVRLRNNESPNAASSNEVDIFKRLGIDHSPESTAALIAFSDLIVHVCSVHANPFDSTAQPVTSCVRIAMQHTLLAAAFIKEVCAKADSKFEGHYDPRFFTMPGGNAATLALRHLPCWTAMMALSKAGGLPTRPTWSATCRQSATIFTTALTRIASGNLAVHPTAYPFMATQTLWTWPSGVVSPDKISASTTDLETQRRAEVLKDPPKIGSRSDHAQFVAAKQSLCRLDIMLEALGVEDDGLDAHAVRRAVVLGRPSITVGQWSDGVFQTHINQLNDGMDKQKELTDKRVLDSGLLRASWARRSVGEYSTWRTKEPVVEEALKTSIESALKTMASLSLNPNSMRKVVYYVPIGTLPGRSPLSGSQLAFSETRVWVNNMSGVLHPPDAPPNIGIDASIEMVMCKPNDGAIASPNNDNPAFDPQAAARPLDDASGVTTVVNPLILERLGTTITVPVCVDAYDSDHLETTDTPYEGPIVIDRSTRLSAVIGDVRNSDAREVPKDRPDRYRCILFSAERIWQALTLAAASEAKTLAIRIPGTLPEWKMKRLVASTSLACGMLPSIVGDTMPQPRFGLDMTAVPAAERVAAVARLTDALQGLNNAVVTAREAGLSVAPVSEMAAAVALWSQ